MPGPHPRPLSRAQREAAFLERAARMYGKLEDWYDQHPDASFGEIETHAREVRRELMGAGWGIVINGRDTGYQSDPPPCPSCGQPMDFARYRPWTVSSLEGDTELSRAYYVCPRCVGQTLSPPRPQTASAGGSLE